MSVNLILKNNLSSPVEVELVDIYGGNFLANIDGEMSQNHTVLEGSEIIVNGNVICVVALEDEGKEIVVAE